MPRYKQFFAQIPVVIDLTVENDGNAAILVKHRLLPAGKIDNRQPPHRQTGRLVDPFAALIRPSVQQARIEPREQCWIDYRTVLINDSADPTHILFRVSQTTWPRIKNQD